LLKVCGLEPLQQETDEWIYGGRLEQIHQTLVEGRPNGMPACGGKIPDDQLWQITAYVRSMSLPATLAAQKGPTPSQSPAPVPRDAETDTGWSAPPGPTNDNTTTVEGPP
jgi:cytochrome c oxidase cbb3-type subunit 3